MRPGSRPCCRRSESDSAINNGSRGRWPAGSARPPAPDHPPPVSCLRSRFRHNGDHASGIPRARFTANTSSALPGPGPRRAFGQVGRWHSRSGSGSVKLKFLQNSLRTQLIWIRPFRPIHRITAAPSSATPRSVRPVPPLVKLFTNSPCSGPPAEDIGPPCIGPRNPGVSEAGSDRPDPCENGQNDP